jgi:hypothetical protein
VRSGVLRFQVFGPSDYAGAVHCHMGLLWYRLCDSSMADSKREAVLDCDIPLLLRLLRNSKDISNCRPPGLLLRCNPYPQEDRG